MRKTAVYGTAFVVLAMVANVMHANSHVGQDVLSLAAWQWAYVIGVNYLAPIVAAALLWNPLRRAAAWLVPFWGSAVLLVAVSGIGVLVGGWAARRLSHPQASTQPGDIKKGHR